MPISLNATIYSRLRGVPTSAPIRWASPRVGCQPGPSLCIFIRLPAIIKPEREPYLIRLAADACEAPSSCRLAHLPLAADVAFLD